MNVTKYKIPTIKDIRIAMTKDLSIEDYQQYHAITMFRTIGSLYDRLYSIKIIEELILF